MFLISLDMSLVHEFKFSPQKSHLTVLILMFFKLLVYFLVEQLLAYRHCKFVVSPWIIYGLYINDTIINQTITLKKLELVETAFPIYQVDDNGKLLALKQNFSYEKLNLNFFLHTSLLAVFIILLLIKIFKFIWKEFCYHKNISI
jgi:hypothetical protein